MASLSSSMYCLVFLGLLMRWLVKVLRPWVTRPKGGTYAPGPTPLPIIGNMLDIPASDAGEVYRQWGRKYNTDILFASALGSHVLVLNRQEDADELLERRSRMYSDRARLPMLDLMEWDYNIAFGPYSDQWRRSRKVFQEHFRQDVMPGYYPVIRQKAEEMLKRLYLRPDDFLQHTQLYSISIPMATMYGYHPESIADPAVFAAEKAVHLATCILLPGATIANTFPVLRYLPSWLPGASFKKTMIAARNFTREMRRLPKEFVQQQIANGVSNPSIIGNFMKRQQANPGLLDDEVVYMNVAVTTYGAATETTTSLLASFFYYIAINPQVQRKAQDELDSVLGTRRLPTYADRPDLPYIEAIYRELHRLEPPVPVGIPHIAARDDFYKGYFVPKGTAVIGNIWAICRDERSYPNPDEFRPERYFDEKGELNNDDRILAFGFGRRVCAGKHMASATMWLAIASVLAIYKIDKARDDQGQEIDIDIGFDDFGVTRQKRPFRCSIVCRSNATRELVESLDADM